MSGGVDSSVAAALMVEAGHDVVGIAMKTHNLTPRHNRACCTPDDMRDARTVAADLGIPFYVINYADLFEEQVVLPFAQAYARGETPNPCIECNEKVKFVPLLARAELLGAEFLVTGHYARVDEGADGHSYLRRGVYGPKDQSYFLYRMTESQLRRVLFPLGSMTKPEVRALATGFGLPTADKHESQEICFVGDEGYPATVERVLARPLAHGNIVDDAGTVLGQHEGIHRYTIGQRRGLGIAAETPLYVIDIDAAHATVTVGPQEALNCRSLDLSDVHWNAGAPGADETVWAQLRYRAKPVPARVVGARLEFSEPISPGAPGQAAVIYRDDWVLGGGRVRSRHSAETGQRVGANPSLPVL